MKVTPPGAALPLDAIKRDLRIVVFDCPYDTIENEKTQRLLGKVASMKITGYRKEYPYGVLPVDTTDFVGVHLLLCEETKSGLEPIAGYKSITLEKSKIHNLTFPALNLIAGNDLPDHRKAIEQIIEVGERKHEAIGYNGSWTVRPDLRHDRNIIQLSYDLAVVWFARYYPSYRIPHVLAGATVRFKVHEFKEFMGFEYLKLNGKALSSFPCKPFFGEEVSIMYLKKCSPAAERLSERYDAFWDRRYTIAGQSNSSDIKIAA